ncbi:alpha/beta fold hydrolase [Streptomyces niveus]|uniref:alpha/beta fold hydrolase n=1 Tax=Streptomyces niveus TaxID=193462 RepID=UPI003723A029
MSRFSGKSTRPSGGPASGTTLALIHGWGLNRTDFDAIADHLPDDVRVIAVGFAEHGESWSTRNVWTIEEFGRDVAAVLEAESTDTAIVAGHSLGGAEQPITVFPIRELTDQEAIERYGDRIDIVLVDLGSHHFQAEAPEGTRLGGAGQERRRPAMRSGRAAASGLTGHGRFSGS